MKIEIQPVAFVHNARTTIEDDYWGPVTSIIELVPEVPENAFDGIDAFSHLEILFYFNQSDPGNIIYHGHPRGNTAWPAVGIFAQRKRDRPNALGLTTAKLVKHEGRRIWVQHLDAIDGTPVIDIKPVMKEFLPAEPVLQPAWSTALMEKYWAAR